MDLPGDAIWAQSGERYGGFIELSLSACYLEITPAPGDRRRATKEDYVLSLHTQAGLPAEDRAGLMAQSQLTSETLLERILTSLSDDKAEDVVQVDLRGRSSFGDYMVIASGRSTRQVSSMAEKLTDRIKQEFGYTSKVEGKDAGDWVLIDTGDVIVHIFRPEVREFYQLEKMWLPQGSSASAN